jgi:polysaccharide pyruvyl transferase WcaK-like protein
MRIGLFGLFGCGNSGNDASLESMLVFLRRAGFDQRLVCICPAPERVEQVYRVATTPMGPNFRADTIGATINRLLGRVPYRLIGVWSAIQTVRKLDVIVVPGTGFLDDFQDSPFGWPFMVFKWCSVAWILRKKVVFVSIGAGPIKHGLSRFFMKKAAQTASYRSYRDVASRQFMKSIGIDVEKDKVYPDIVFSLPKPSPLVPEKRPITVGVGVMSYFGWSKGNVNGEAIYRHYLRKLQDFVTWLLAQGIHVRLLTGDKMDWSAIEDFTKEIRASTSSNTSAPRLVAVRTHSLQELMGEIVETDVVVVSRYHNLVCALKLGRPAVSLEYSQKNRSLMEEMDLGEFCQTIETFDLELLKQQFGDALDQRVKLKEQILAWDEEFARRLSTQENKLLNFVSDPAPRASDAAMTVAN